MLTYPEALALIQAAARPVAARSVALGAALGTVAAEDLGALANVPAFLNAAMDGYALRAVDTAGASADQPLRIPVAGSIPAGTRAAASGEAATAWEIMTGAPLPAGCDAVVPVERVSRIDAGRDIHALAGLKEIVLTRTWAPGQNVRRIGEDFVARAPVVAEGLLLDERALMALAATGHEQMVVRGPLRAAVLTTGAELRRPGSAPDLPVIVDANGPYLAAALPAAGACLTRIATAGDDREGIATAIGQLAAGADIVLTTGGVSAGRMDLVPAALTDLKADILFHKVAVKPGKPILLARLPGGPLVVGLPGNPIAVAVGFRFFVVPALRAMTGRAPETFARAICQGPLRTRGDVRFFAKARVTLTAAGLRAEILPGQESFRIAPLLRANAWAVLPEGQSALSPGEEVEVASQHPAGLWDFSDGVAVRPLPG